MYKYYSTQRPIMPGSFPKPVGNKITNIFNFEEKTYCEEIGRKAWGWIEYKEPVSADLLADYELQEVENE